jgi:hypothetical protein
MTKVCTICGSHGEPKKKTQGSLLIELVLWCMFIAPGFIYSIWRATSKLQVCRSCESTALVPSTSHIGQKIMAERRAS